MNSIEIEITVEDRKKCKYYGDLYHCLLATALRRKFKGVKLCVGGSDVDMQLRGGKAFCYDLAPGDSTKVSNSYIAFEPLTVTLTQTGPTVPANFTLK